MISFPTNKGICIAFILLHPDWKAFKQDPRAVHRMPTTFALTAALCYSLFISFFETKKMGTQYLIPITCAT